jgi:cytochrome P450/NADPH-cytochrome P450 reductase
MSPRPELAPIPQPKPDPVLGNIKDLDPKATVQSLSRLALTYGPIYRLSLPGGDVIFVSSQELVDEVSDETRFEKGENQALENLREFAGDGLVTAHSDEANWGKAHRILMPAFGPAAMRDMFDGMHDIADQLLTRWERFGHGAVIDVVDDMTRLTLDTIALCAMSYRFNSFYQNESHPFVGALVRALAEAVGKTARHPLQTRLMLLTRRRNAEDIRLMHQIADELVAQRRAGMSSVVKKDLLSRLIEGRDPETGEGLSDENIRYQMVTFLAAGHETTSGLISFALYFLLKHPDAMERARAQVDQVLGSDTPPRFEHLAQLPYLEQVLKEALRLRPPAPTWGRRPLEDTVIGGKYFIERHKPLSVLVHVLHRDPRVWGEDPERFDPDRFAPDAAAKLPANAWKPFGTGHRACIGSQFALTEAHLFLASALQRFDLTAHDPSYQLEIQETLTFKPSGFFIHAKRRGAQSFKLKTTIATPSRPLTDPAPAPAPVEASGSSTPLLVLYGSNSGSAEAFAQRIAADAKAHGYAPELGILNDYAAHLPTVGAVIVVTASYEGQPTDNARQFVAWLDTLQPGDLSGVKFGVFGCGNRDWVRTYQAIPRKIDAGLEAAGATRVVERGEADARGDFFGDFDRWYDKLWGTLGETFATASPAPADGPLFVVEVVQETRAARLRQAELQAGVIVENRELADLSSPLGRSKRHIEIALPAGMTYRAGDYLAVLPINPGPSVERALRRFGFGHDSHVTIHKSRDSETSLPTGHPVNVYEVLAAYVELGQPATKKQVETLAGVTPCPPERRALERLLEQETYEEEVLAKRVSLLDLLERTASCQLTFGAFLEMLPPMRSRQYSISSTPLWNETHCTLTVAVVDGPAHSGGGRYLGVASNYLAGAEPGAQVSVAVRPSNVAFHPPEDLETPLVMICAGTGLAPFRGFLQERAIQAAAGRPVAKSLLFFGCDHPDVDMLYRDELEAWEQAGIVDVRPAFSAAPQGDDQFVQHRLWHERAEVVALFRQGARIFVCGDARTVMAGVRETAARIYEDATHCTPEDAERWVGELERNHSRFYADVFA